eukprot:c23737_g1_i1 orf=196-1083(+)
MEEGLHHRYVHVNGIRMHFVEQGRGPLILLLHGFPEFWYSWRYQISFLANAGFHVVAPDLRGFGETEAPQRVDDYTSFHVVGDLISLLDVLGKEEAFVVGHDFGAIFAWDFCLLRPDRVRALVCLSVPFLPRKPSGSFLSEFRAELGENFYMHRFQELGKQEMNFKEMGAKTLLKKIFLQEYDLNYYTGTYEKSGFTGPLSVYRAIERTWELKAAWTNIGVKTSTLFVIGSRDIVYHMPGIKSYIENRFKNDVPNLRDIIFLEGNHFVHQEDYEKFNQLLLQFLQAHNNVNRCSL